MPSWTDCWGVAVRVTDDRLAHVLEHPEMRGEQERMMETLAAPDLVVRSRSDSDVRLYHRHYASSAVGAKFLCVVVKWGSSDALLITAYFTDRPKRGEVLWTKQ